MILLLMTSCAGPRASVQQVEVAHAMDETLYAVVLSTRKHQLSGQNPTVGLFRSRDLGATWKHTGWPQGRAFAVMAAPGGRGDTVFLAAGNGLMRTTDGGGSWRITTDWQMTEVQDVAVNPNRPAQVLAATPYGVFRSDELGEGWAEASGGLDARFVSSVRFDRTSARRAFAGTESGLYVSDDGGERWTPTELREPVRSVRQSPSHADRWVAALQDRGVALSEDGGRTWRFGGGAVDGRTLYASEFHPSDPDVLYAGGWETGVLRSDDFGRSWQPFTRGLTDLALNVHALAISRTTPDVVFAGTMGGGLYRSSDGGVTWEPVEPDIFDLAQVWDLYVEGE